ncbi:MAG: tRNA uridine-5-carboxymethylaminomethyl(34) synthesis GTPase MnmE [Oscillospiraceae bacterium]|nr:tRNA uridine-5-carboxymethylaminomethyl(34) synthesis GTPase MnmE [Oscillospiraceae bacterium]
MSNCIAAMATAPGKASLCSIRISGDNAFEIASRVFVPADKKKNVMEAKGYTAMFGSFYRKGEEIDQAVALFFRAPRSYTGENVVEISCHGGSAVADQLLKACYEAGAAPAGAGEFTKRAFLNGKMSITQAEAVMEMINATNSQTLNAAKSALEGHLYKRAAKIRDDLLVLVGHISAYTDYPEEAVEDVTDDEVRDILLNAQASLKKLLDGYDNGAKIKQGVHTAIVGKPNVGKSTLLNALSGFEKAIVTPIAGTTRDVVEQEVILGGVNLILQDTAGIRATDDEVEAIGIQRSLDRLQGANLVFCVFDGSRETAQDDIELAARCKGLNSIAIINKQDLQQKFDVSAVEGNFKKVLYITAKDFYMSKEFENDVMEVLGVADIDVTTGAIVNERQYEAVRTAYNSITDAYNTFEMGYSLDIIGVCVDEALYAVYGLTGENVSDEVVNEVFSKFCVGK